MLRHDPRRPAQEALRTICLIRRNHFGAPRTGKKSNFFGQRAVHALLAVGPHGAAKHRVPRATSALVAFDTSEAESQQSETSAVDDSVTEPGLSDV